MQNVGLFTSTDLGLTDRIRSGEEISIEELLRGRDPIASAILRAGGLLAYGSERLQSINPVVVPEPGRLKTLFEKIINRHALSTEDAGPVMAIGQSGFFAPITVSLTRSIRVCANIFFTTLEELPSR